MFGIARECNRSVATLWLWPQERQAEHEAGAAAQQQAAEEEDQEDMSLFEIQRRANIKRNQQRMASMGLPTKAASLPLPGQH